MEGWGAGEGASEVPEGEEVEEVFMKQGDLQQMGVGAWGSGEDEDEGEGGGQGAQCAQQ